MKYLVLALIIIGFWSCKREENRDLVITSKDLIESVTSGQGNSFDYAINIPHSGRYRVTIKTTDKTLSSVWIEDYITNTDDRTYNVTGDVVLSNSMGSVDGSPLAHGLHNMTIHGLSKTSELDYIEFTLLKAHRATPNFYVQNMLGSDWEIVWSDEFNYQGTPDTSLWSYNIGNWGWGNNELQYYTQADTNNASVDNGHLTITARKNAETQQWTSARLTTAGKHSFTYGKIEFRAKVPAMRGTWAAGWTLGDSYTDEISWPYCGEIDILECVGFEINDTTGNGINHATCHTRAYYFKQGNQIGSQIEVDSMDTQFHLYSVEWDESEIRGYLDGEHYYTYDKSANEREWPFSNPQNIIVNLAIGGGWGGAKGLDPNLENPSYVLDYVRVYQRKK